eukprot:UN03691
MPSDIFYAYASQFLMRLNSDMKLSVSSRLKEFSLEWPNFEPLRTISFPVLSNKECDNRRDLPCATTAYMISKIIEIHQNTSKYKMDCVISRN